MIQLKMIRIDEFRGIRHLELDLDCKSFVVVGPNGSGKSGVVDAIDFALTGNVRRLSGAGTGGITVVKHGPHVLQRDNPAAAKVSLTIRHCATGQEAVLTRCVNSASQYTLAPSTPGLRAAVDWMAEHPELTLSRREVIKYVNAEAGKRAQEVQALLKLDRINETRRLLRSALTKTNNATDAARSEVNGAEDSLRRHLNLSDLAGSQIMTAVNNLRDALDLHPLAAVAPETDLSVGTPNKGGQRDLDKPSAIRDVDALNTFISDHETLDRLTSDLGTVLDEVATDHSIVTALKNRRLVESGLALVSDATCPLCDQSWANAQELRRHLNGKLARSESAAALEQRLTSVVSGLLAELRRVRYLVEAVQPCADALGSTLLQSDLTALTNRSAGFEKSLDALESLDSVTEQSPNLEMAPLPATLSDELTALRSAVDGLTDQSAADAVRTTLTVAQDRWTRLCTLRVKLTRAQDAQKIALSVYNTYNTVADAALTALYGTVQDKFSSYYRQINADDESSFKADLAPSAGKLDLEVDFYGLGMFPPLAYHSEGHQDGMGLSLYLALLGQLLQADFRLAILDDVVTSVDSNHRRQFCRLLKDAFPGVQFILTTHEEVWARQMQSSGLISRSSLARFQGWTVDGGPLYGKGGDFWTQVEADLSRDDVPGAAHKLRRNLEASLADMATNLHGKVTYRADNNYDLSSLFSAVKGAYGDLLKKAAASADSWNNNDARKRVAELKEAQREAYLDQDRENWAINALVHSNDWANMCKADFTPVVEACKRFLDLFTCDNPECESWVYVTGRPGSEEELRCACSSLNLNLRKR